MNLRELLFLPNLLSLSRVGLAALIVVLLARGDASVAWWALLLVIVAAITDGLDGYLARRRGLVTALGVALDPIADKIFAGLLVIGLILFREFPLWLAGLVIGRDLLILLGGIALLRGRPALTLPSNLTGKWAFAALAVLLGAHVIRFDFSIEVMTPIATVLQVMSLVVYLRVFQRVRRGERVEPFRDRAALKVARYALCSIVAVAHFWMFWFTYLR